MAGKKPDPNTKQRGKKSSNDGKKRMDISAVAIIDNIVFNKTEAMAYYKIKNSVFDFLSSEAKVAAAQRLINAFVNLMSDKQEPLDCQVIITSIPVNVEAWEEQIETLSLDWSRGPGFEQFLEEQADYLRQEEFMHKVTYLGVSLGKRGAMNIDTSTILNDGVKDAWEIFKKWLNKALQVPGEEISLTEERDARSTEENIYRILSTGNLQAEKCTAEEILLLIKRQFYPAMSAPYLDVDYENRIGPGDLELELTSAIENRLRYLKINQIDGMMTDAEGNRGVEMDGYRAALTISRLPKAVNFPYSTFPFLYFLYYSGYPFTSYSRFTLHPTKKMKAELEKKKKEAKDEMENLSNSGTFDSSLGMLPTDVQESLEDMKMMNEMLTEGKTPWVEGTYRVVVEAFSEALLKDYCSRIKQRYVDLDVNINWTVGDQAELFLEQMPGDKLRSKSHKQLTNLAYFGTSGFNYASDVGDYVFAGNSTGGR